MGNISYTAHVSNKKSAITSKSKLAGVAKHNLRKYKSEEYSADNIFLIYGTDNLVQDVKAVYHQRQELLEIENRASKNTSIISAFETNNYLTEDEAMKVPAVYACVELISSTIAQLPVYLYKENEDGSIERVANDYREYLLNVEPNEFQNAYNFKKNIVKDHLLYGVSYTDIERKGNAPFSYKPSL